MKYYCVDFKITPFNEAFCDVLSNEIFALGFDSFEYLPQGIAGYITQEQWDEEALKQILANYPIPEVEIAYTLSEAPDENWNSVWEEEGFQPILIDSLICVHDTRKNAPVSVKYDILINPCQAFGTGSHVTTRLILKQLSQMPMQGFTVVDAGTGTGVLSIMCGLRGGSKVFAYDIDEWSVRNALDNISLNHLQNVEVVLGDSRVLASAPKCDLLLANINRNILLADMERFVATLKPMGRMILSGFYVEDIPLLETHAKSLGLTLVQQMSDEGWAMLLFELDATSW